MYDLSYSRSHCWSFSLKNGSATNIIERLIHSNGESYDLSEFTAIPAQIANHAQAKTQMCFASLTIAESANILKKL